jgi:hypothetical protein
MAEDRDGPVGPDLAQGVAFSDSPTGASWWATSGTSRCSLRAKRSTFSRSGLTAPTTMDRSSTGSSSMRRCAVLGITPVLTSELAKPCTRRHSARLIPGQWSSATARSSCAKSGFIRNQNPAPSQRLRHRAKSWSSVAAPRDLPPSRCFGGRSTKARSSC